MDCFLLYRLSSWENYTSKEYSYGCHKLSSGSSTWNQKLALKNSGKKPITCLVLRALDIFRRITGLEIKSCELAEPPQELQDLTEWPLIIKLTPNLTVKSVARINKIYLQQSTFNKIQKTIENIDELDDTCTSNPTTNGQFLASSTWEQCEQKEVIWFQVI